MKKGIKTTMNKIEKFVLNQGKKILIKHALSELDELKRKLLSATDTLHFNILNTGLLLDLKAAQKKGIEALEKRLLEMQKKGKKTGLR